MYELIRKLEHTTVRIQMFDKIEEAIVAQQKLENAYGNPGIYKIVSWN